MLAVIAASVGLLLTVGVFLILHRSLVRVVLGLSCLAHAIHLVVMSAGRWGARAPLVREGIRAEEVTDPVTQAFVLTAIVISMAFTLYLLAGMSAQARRGGVPELAPPPTRDDERTPEALRAELEGREVEP